MNMTSISSTATQATNPADTRQMMDDMAARSQETMQFQAAVADKTSIESAFSMGIKAQMEGNLEAGKVFDKALEDIKQVSPRA